MAVFSQIKLPDGVDAAKANRIIKWIVEAEAENNKTSKKTDNEMIHEIAKQIQSDVKCL